MKLMKIIKGPSCDRPAVPWNSLLLNDVYALLNNLPRKNVDSCSYVR